MAGLWMSADVRGRPEHRQALFTHGRSQCRQALPARAGVLHVSKHRRCRIALTSCTSVTVLVGLGRSLGTWQGRRWFLDTSNAD
jgi:hypothetical protein